MSFVSSLLFSQGAGYTLGVFVLVLALWMFITEVSMAKFSIRPVLVASIGIGILYAVAVLEIIQESGIGVILLWGSVAIVITYLLLFPPHGGKKK